LLVAVDGGEGEGFSDGGRVFQMVAGLAVLVVYASVSEGVACGGWKSKW